MKLLHTYKDFKKAKVAAEELQRAHIIIALLAVALAFLVAISSIYPIQLDELLSGIVAALLVIVAAISLSISLMIRIKK